MKVNYINPQFVDFIPEILEEGNLYISKRYSTATHLCCCGCGNKVVTPLNPAKWRLVEKNGAVFLSPSVGNWSLPCQSHYWIRGNVVEWAGAIDPAMISAVQARDRRDAEAMAPKPVGWFGRAANWVYETISGLFGGR